MTKNKNAHIELLGKTAKDRVTGAQGVVTSISFDLFGCIQAVVTPPLDKDGKKQESHWFDVNRLEVLDAKRCMPVPEFAVAPEVPAKFGATPATHAHGPAEKPAR